MRGLLCFLLVLAACAPAAVPKAPTSTLPSSQPEALPKIAAATPTSAGALGNQLGAAALGDSEAQVMATLGRPTRQTITHGIGSPRWEYDSGYVIAFSGTDRRVWQIRVEAPAVVATGEGFALRDTVGVFRSIYAGFQIQEFPFPGSLQLQVASSDETLIVGFGVDGRSQFVLLNAPP